MPALLRLMGSLLLVWPVLALASGPAAAGVESCAEYPQSAFVQPVTGALPVHPWTSRADIAAFAMPYALMAEDSNRRHRDRLGPYGFYRGPNSNQILTGVDQLHADAVGFFATTYIHCTANAVVIVFRSLSNLDPRDYVAGYVRQVGGGETQLPLTFFDEVRERYPGYAIMVVGHSSGGGLASYVGALKHVPSVAFNPVLFEGALLNSGEQQLVVRVTGDIYSDPSAAAQERLLGLTQDFLIGDTDIRGQIFRLDPPEHYRRVWELHYISVIIDALDRLMN